MRYRILGPLEVTDDEGRTVALAGRSERVLLACLLLEANRVVSSDRLIDALWGERPPETAANAVQVHVSKLRRKLIKPSGSDGPLETSSPGYVLRTAPGELDSERFEELVTIPSSGEPSETSERLSEALELWRGPVLSGLENDITAHSDIARLEGLRVSAIVRRIEADLALGRHAQLVGELEGLIASNPLNEGLRGQLMVALYRSGRQADALGVYRETRRVLAEELGIDPSPVLQGLELAVLNQSTELDAPAERATTTSLNAKRQSGTLTFLFSDIEGSTALLRRLGEDSYAQVLADHHHLIRSALAAHEGTEVGTQGDGFFAVFPSSRAGAASVIEMQRSLASHEWPNSEQIRVRMGIHAGEASERSTGLVGLDIHKAARVADAAHGGQVLLSETAAALVRDYLPEGASLRDLGNHRLKDLGRPEQIFQLDIDGLPDEFPPIRTLDNPALANNLPAQLSSFVGREVELSQIRAVVETSRLVTLTGPGGSGKTRLALQVAAELLDGSSDGVWLVEFAAISDPDSVPDEVARALRVRELPDRTIDEALVGTLQTRTLLLVLDNCEHLIESVASLTETLLRFCAGIKILATSREALAVPGETVIRIAPMATPPSSTERPEDVRKFEAVSLFVERAFTHYAPFQLNSTNAASVASICRHLDGMPLAIELAAARLSSLSVVDVEERLGSRFRLLTGGSRTALPRQKTLLAAVDWSYDLLTTVEKAVFNRLSVFVGGWDLRSAEVVCDTGDTTTRAVADVLGSLVDKSLVHSEPGPNGTIRYRQLETIRDYAIDKLAEEGRGAVASAKAAHAEAFLALTETAASQMTGPQQSELLARLELEHENLLAALSHFMENGDGESSLRFAVSLRNFWLARGYYNEGIGILESALALGHGPDIDEFRGSALVACGTLRQHARRHDASAVGPRRGTGHRA